jgi:cell division protein FtsQ
MPVSAPADKRFRRAHVRPTRRKPWRRQQWLQVGAVAVVVLLLAFGLFEVVGYALSSERLAIKRISVSGNARIPSGEVRTLLSDLIGRSVLTADLEASRQKLLDSPWVAEAEIRRVLPGSIAVAVAERHAVAVARLGADLYLIDQTGTIIGPYGPAYAQFDLPSVDGLVSGSESGLTVDPDRAVVMAEALTALQADSQLASRVSQLDVSNPRDVVLTLKNDTVAVRVGNEKFVERLQMYLELASTLRDRVEDIDYVDMRYGERLFVGMRHPAHAGRGTGDSK